MTRPGVRLHSIAARWCRPGTMERLFDPVLADLQAEYEDAVRGGRMWQSRWVWILGHVAFFKLVAWHGGERAMCILHELTREDRRTLGFCVGTTVVFTLLLVGIPLLSWSHPEPARWAIYLIPGALPISIPIGLTFGILWGLGRVAASRRSRRLVLLLAIAASVASFTMLAWVLPAANHAFRVSVAGRPFQKGTNELTLSELGRLLEPGTHEPMAVAPPATLRTLALVYHTRWALACAPFVLSLFALAVTGRGQRGRLMLGLAGCAAIFGYYVIMVAAGELGLDRTLPVFAAAWTPNALFLILSVAVMKVGLPRSRLAARV
jgi:Lipopolysaccharide export system permease LptF/LptG